MYMNIVLMCMVLVGGGCFVERSAERCGSGAPSGGVGVELWTIRRFGV